MADKKHRGEQLWKENGINSNPVGVGEDAAIGEGKGVAGAEALSATGGPQCPSDYQLCECPLCIAFLNVSIKSQSW